MPGIPHFKKEDDDEKKRMVKDKYGVVGYYPDKHFDLSAIGVFKRYAPCLFRGRDEKAYGPNWRRFSEEIRYSG